MVNTRRKGGRSKQADGEHRCQNGSERKHEDITSIKN
jgi:hypothetical protein